MRVNFGLGLVERFKLTLGLKLWLGVKGQVGLVLEVVVWPGWGKKIKLELGWRWG